MSRARDEVILRPAPRVKQHRLRKPPPPVNVRTNTSSSGCGMSKYLAVHLLPRDDNRDRDADTMGCAAPRTDRLSIIGVTPSKRAGRPHEAAKDL